MFAPTVTMDLKKSPLKIARFSKKPFVIFRVSTQASLFREVHIFRESSQLVGPKFRKKDQCMVYIYIYLHLVDLYGTLVGTYIILGGSSQDLDTWLITMVIGFALQMA